MTALVAAASGPVFAGVELLETPALHSDSAASSVLLDIAASDDGYLVSGERGILLQWHPSGQWQQQDSPVSVTLTDIETAAGGNAYAVGHDGVVLRRDADGKWHKIFDGYALSRLQIAALEKKRDALRNAIDNPAQDADVEELEYQLEEVEFGIEDARAELESGPTRPLLDILVAGDDLFAVGAYGTLLKSADGGENWQLLSSRLDNPGRLHLNAIARSASGSLIIVGESGIGFVSHNGGQTWVRMDLPYAGSLFGVIAQKDTKNLVAYGLQGNLLLSRDDGETWQHRRLQAGVTLLGGTVTDSGAVYLVGHGGVVVNFPIDNPDALVLRKHPSGAALAAVRVAGDRLILAGQFGVTTWDKNGKDNRNSKQKNKEVAGHAE